MKLPALRPGPRLRKQKTPAETAEWVTAHVEQLGADAASKRQAASETKEPGEAAALLEFAEMEEKQAAETARLYLPD